METSPVSDQVMTSPMGQVRPENSKSPVKVAMSLSQMSAVAMSGVMPAWSMALAIACTQS